MVNLQGTFPENRDITDFTLFDSDKHYICYFFFRSTSTAHWVVLPQLIYKEEIRYITSMKGEKYV